MSYSEPSAGDILSQLAEAPQTSNILVKQLEGCKHPPKINEFGYIEFYTCDVETLQGTTIAFFHVNLYVPENLTLLLVTNGNDVHLPIPYSKKVISGIKYNKYFNMNLKIPSSDGIPFIGTRLAYGLLLDRKNVTIQNIE